MSKKKQYTKGFTLLELLVVISIIGILIAMGVVAYSTAQKKGRDARRRADLQAIQDAQEQYYQANTAYGTRANLILAANKLLNTWPRDPKTNTEYPMATSGTPLSYYCSCALLDEAKGNSNGPACTWAAGNDGSYFCVSSLQ